MEKYLLCYYSGTGNTEYLVRKFIDLLDKQIIQVTVIDFTKNIETEIDFNEYSLIGFFYPIHAFNTPSEFYKVIKNLNINNKEYFIIKNSREYLSLNNSSSDKIIKVLKKKKCKLISEYHLLMPYNIQYRHSNQFVKQILISINDKLPVITNEIMTRKHSFIKRTILSKIISFVFRIEWPGARIIGKTFKTTSDCTLCSKCVRECPNSNITFDKEKKKIIFGNKCMLCMRCVMNCQAKAIKMKILKNWEVYGKYDFEKIINDSSIEGNFITEKSKGFLAKSYKQYFLDTKDKNSKKQ